MRTTLQNRQAAPALDRATVDAPESARPAKSERDRRRAALMRPPPSPRMCEDCWGHGIAAADKAWRAGGIEAARLAEPMAREYAHKLADWTAGRDAYVARMTQA